MHTAICTFERHADAQRAVDRLVQSGYDRSDVHLEYRHADGSPMQAESVTRQGAEPLMHGEPADAGQANDNWDGLEREVAVDPGRFRALGDFFHRLFGSDEGAGHAASYSGAIERGHCVVIVDAHDDEEADRAQSLLHGLEARDMNMVHRAGQRPLRDIVGERQAMDMEEQFGTARSEMGASHNMDTRSEGEFPRERAMASQGWGEQRKLELVDDDQPIASPDLRSLSDREDKPR
jgi:hypothetical protein